MANVSKALFIGTVPLDFLDHSESDWRAATMQDILQKGYIHPPQNYFFTLGSGVNSTMISLATTPVYYLPTNSQFYLAGRDVFRWGGSADPYEIDIDHYGFSPDYMHDAAVMWRAPKSEPHHLSEMPQMMDHVPDEWREFCESILGKRLPVSAIQERTLRLHPEMFSADISHTPLV